MEKKKIITIALTVIGLVSGVIGIKAYFFDKDKIVPAIQVELKPIAQDVEATKQNTAKILELLLNKEKKLGQNPQLVEELKKKIEGLETVLNRQKLTDGRGEIALKELQKGNLTEARKLFETLRDEEREKEKEHAETAYNLGNVYFIELKFKDALEAYLDAVKLDPGNSLYFSESGKVFQQLAQYDEAISYYEMALEIFIIKLGKEHPSTKIVSKSLNLTKAGKMK